MEKYDVIIVGAGVTGSSIDYIFDKYTDVSKRLLIEKEDWFARIASNSRVNSQTWHTGRVETNYSLEKLLKVKKGADMLIKYSEILPRNIRDGIFFKCPQMVLGVGDEEVDVVEKRHEVIGPIFPDLKKLDKESIGSIEPNILKGRKNDEKISALYTDDTYMIDYGKLAASFFNGSVRNRLSKPLFNTRVKSMDKISDGYVVNTNRGLFVSGAVIFATGSYSLYFSKSMGYEKDYSLLPVGGNFYYSPKVLDVKVYRIQKGDIPFANIHGDPDLNEPTKTRFGPTVSVLPTLEKNNFSSAMNFAEMLDFSSIESMAKIMLDKDIRNIIYKNLSFSVPFLGKRKFLNEVRKIVPSLNYSNLEFARDAGGIRPQLVDKRQKKLVLGVSKFAHDGAVFVVTPSPGATVCMEEAVENVSYTSDFLGKRFDKERFEKDFCCTLN